MNSLLKASGVDNTDCRTKEGVTVSMIDTISFLLGQLSERDLETPNAQEALKDLMAYGKYPRGSANRKYSVMLSIKPIKSKQELHK